MLMSAEELYSTLRRGGLGGYAVVTVFMVLKTHFARDGVPPRIATSEMFEAIFVTLAEHTSDAAVVNIAFNALLAMTSAYESRMEEATAAMKAAGGVRTCLKIIHDSLPSTHSRTPHPRHSDNMFMSCNVLALMLNYCPAASSETLGVQGERQIVAALSVGVSSGDQGVCRLAIKAISVIACGVHQPAQARSSLIEAGAIDALLSAISTAVVRWAPSVASSTVAATAD